MKSGFLYLINIYIHGMVITMTLGQSDFLFGQVSLSLINLFKPKPVLVLFENVIGSMEARLKKLNRVFPKKCNLFQSLIFISQ